MTKIEIGKHKGDPVKVLLRDGVTHELFFRKIVNGDKQLLRSLSDNKKDNEILSLAIETLLVDENGEKYENHKSLCDSIVINKDLSNIMLTILGEDTDQKKQIENTN